MKKTNEIYWYDSCFPRGCGHPLPPLHRFPLAGLLLVVCLLGFGITQPVDVSAASMSEPRGAKLALEHQRRRLFRQPDRHSLAGQLGQRSGPEREPASVHARFDLNSVSGAPFPTDLYTVADPRSRTGTQSEHAAARLFDTAVGLQRSRRG